MYVVIYIRHREIQSGGINVQYGSVNVTYIVQIFHMCEIDVTKTDIVEILDLEPTQVDYRFVLFLEFNVIFAGGG